MLGYTVVNSSGYFAQSGDYIFLFMFAILLAVSILNTAKIINQWSAYNENNRNDRRNELGVDT